MLLRGDYFDLRAPVLSDAALARTKPANSDSRSLRLCSAGLAEKVKNLCEMGFPEAAVRSALQKCGGDENTALEMLLSGV